MGLRDLQQIWFLKKKVLAPIFFIYEGILVDDMVLPPATIQHPNCMSDYNRQVPAHVLVGVNCAGMFPVSVCHPDGTPVQIKNCRLKRSLVTGRYLLLSTVTLIRS